MWSLKLRLLFGMIIGMVSLLIIFSLLIYHSISRTSFKQFDASLESTAHMLSASVEQDKKGLSLDFDTQLTPEFASGKKTAYYEFWHDDGTVAGKSPSLGDKDLGQFISLASISRWPAFCSFKRNEDRPMRAVVVKFVLRSDKDDPNAVRTPQPLTLTVAKDARQLLGQLRQLQYLLLITSLSIIGIACGIAAVVVGQGLIPLNTVAAQIDNIKEDNLSSRISSEALPAEIVPIQKKLNSLLTRLEASFERERAFNADVAHELRTPLAGIRSIIDVTLTRVRDTNEYQSALTECLEITVKMQAMVDNLLLLARVENGQMKFGREQIKISELIDGCWRSFAVKAANCVLVFENKIDANFMCESDAAGLSMVFSNLLDNAVEYTNQGGRISVTAQKITDGVAITFENPGKPLDSEQVAKVFECFWRGDSSRSGTDVHCGLGLTLVKRIIEALGGSVLAQSQNGLFSIRLTLPFSH
jgi:two-component system, OmpR family, heavy metal sensor histidine kinase CusS